MYEYLFANPPLTWLVAMLLAALATTLVGRPSAAIRFIAFNQVPPLSTAFFVTAPFAPSTPNLLDTLSCFVFEFVVLIALARLFVYAYDNLQRVREGDAKSALWKTVWMQLAIMAPLLASEGFGILSEGSRIDYINEGWLAKYLTYAGLLIAGVQATLVARRITCRSGLGGVDYLIIAINFAISFVSGSKGGVFLWLLSIAALIDYRAGRIRPTVLVSALVASLAAVGLMSAAVADLLGLTYKEFANLALGRFLLTNDSRALAFDLRILAGHEGDLLPASFRSIATAFGHPPADLPLGNLLYQSYFDVTSANGGNTSLSALLIYYMPSAYVVVPALVATAIAFALFFVARRIAARLHKPVYRVAILSGILTTGQLFSQDFLAFQVLLPLLIIAVTTLLLSERGRRLVAC